MKVYIGPYSKRVNSYVHTNYIKKKYGITNWPDDEDYTKFERFLEKIEDTLQWIYNHSINMILDRRKDQTIKVRIDYYDVWGMDSTLAHIVHPMLKKLKDVKHGAPIVDDKDVPVELRSTSAPKLTRKQKQTGHTDENYFKRWDWVLDEMIWAFEQKTINDPESQFHSGVIDHQWIDVEIEGKKMHQLTTGPNHTHSFDREAWEKWNARKQNGFRLFGKYYENLWD